MRANQSCTFPPSCFHSPQLAALTFLSWPSGPRPWLRLLTTSPTELQIGWHTMPQILIQRHNAPTSHTPSILFNSWPHPFCPFPRPFSISFAPALSESASTRPSWQLCMMVGRGHLPLWSAARRERSGSGLTKPPPPRETKVACSIIQTGATPTAASATLTLTNGQKNRWFVHS